MLKTKTSFSAPSPNSEGRKNFLYHATGHHRAADAGNVGYGTIGQEPSVIYGLFEDGIN